MQVTFYTKLLGVLIFRYLLSNWWMNKCSLTRSFTSEPIMAHSHSYWKKKLSSINLDLFSESYNLTLKTMKYGWCVSGSQIGSLTPGREYVFLGCLLSWNSICFLSDENIHHPLIGSFPVSLASQHITVGSCGWYKNFILQIQRKEKQNKVKGQQILWRTIFQDLRI